jgi:cytosine/adenosine deaminase-related metal-dependent hydrolase
MGLLAGAVPVSGPVPGPDAGPEGRARTGDRNQGAPGDGSAEARRAAERVIRLWRRLGHPLQGCPAQAVITPACGLAGVSPDQVRAVLTRCREAGSMLAELIEETGGES